MATVNRTHVTDVFAVPVRNAELVRVDDATPTRTEQEPEARTLFVRPMPSTGCECDVDIDDPTRTQIQDLVNEHSRHLCVCSPNREDMLRARAEMHAHPDWAEYKARRDAAMGRH